ncbi:uncharacterized protein NECHADRAFT_82249 [Fusarium vanettenii 77-13-4]|uniref:Uncharacterized protein n=1 Tax=Fusarium vanettenii (strain ATCC MYA-4622 / CBS 123669 / FGSC 9596 / NRRL 45880 / 77-13-4) TaxID=660122 RepID=C7ZNI8_FUSV7|nr:uncharacterized protein NECHADRAFT_82249 [Fusarium vanettenii 77-13-4]EEU34403.1 hypothetical protein NECHADRAFT_82249 [Fusarium vanettenii 77-13-4]
MWLINTTTIELERADAEELESTPYAILSHTWDDGEVTFDDMMQPDIAKKRRGYTKIMKTCQLAKQRGLAYAWVDTCCVDKRSSAELAEAINSMFRWYQCSAVCLAHLQDLVPHSGTGDDSLSGLSSCRWFTRGWTLQELIAPQNLEFHDSEWRHRGTKTTLRHQISDITGIEVEVLENNAFLESIPIAKRMSWAASRSTTRVEDLAYCLLGIFDVNMPMMYGEGTKAFSRLQEEIAKETTDLSVFAWKAQEETGTSPQDFRGILAQSPAEFAHCRKLRRAPNIRQGHVFTMTNRGLRLETFLGKSDDIDYVLNLDCIIPDDSGGEQRVGVFLSKTADGYVRTRPAELFETQNSWIWAGARHQVFIRKRVTPFASWNLKNLSATNLAFQFNFSPGFQLHSFTAKPADLWDSHRQSFITDNSERFTGFVDFQISDTSDSFVTARLFIVCSLMAQPGDASAGSVKPWVGIYDSLDQASSKRIVDSISGYYSSYGEEFYLHQLRGGALMHPSGLPHETSVPSSYQPGRLYVYLGTPQGLY